MKTLPDMMNLNKVLFMLNTKQVIACCENKQIIGYEEHVGYTVSLYIKLSIMTFNLKSLFLLCSIKEAVYGSGKEVFLSKKEENDAETNVSISCIDCSISR